MEYVYRFEEFWGKGSYPPPTMIVSKEDYDVLNEEKWNLLNFQKESIGARTIISKSYSQNDGHYFKVV